MMNYSLKLVGFLQAVGVGAYIALFATLAYTAQAWARAHAFAIHPVIGITSFLLAFVISALISGSIILAYPAFLFFDGRKGDAMRVVFWRAGWLVVLFLTAIVISLSVIL